jgi:hypothetical protein
LSVDGAALWTSGIQTETRKGKIVFVFVVCLELIECCFVDVFFYQTVYADSGVIKYCSLAANTVLKWPNDGDDKQINLFTN